MDIDTIDTASVAGEFDANIVSAELIANRARKTSHLRAS